MQREGRLPYPFPGSQLAYNEVDRLRLSEALLIPSSTKKSFKDNYEPNKLIITRIETKKNSKF